MRAQRVRLRDFRSYERAEAELGDGLTVVARAERGRQDEPARGRLLRADRALVPHVERARAGAARRGGDAG